MASPHQIVIDKLSLAALYLATRHQLEPHPKALKRWEKAWAKFAAQVAKDNPGE